MDHLVSTDTELSGRKAKQFVWTISERQFQVVVKDEQGREYIMALSSSMSTFLECMSQMMAACGKTIEFEVKKTEVQ
jgi:hypothetical protein